jgi:hypothetical protein
METIYHVDSNRLWTGGVKEIGPKEGRPPSWIKSSTAPATAGVSQWTGSGWSELTQAELDTFGPYPDLTSARVAMLGFIDELTKKITDQYPAAEVSAWPSKAEAARAVIAGTARADQTAMIQDEADLTGATLTDQAAAIVAKAEVFEAIVARVSGLRQVTDAWLVEATTSAEREAVLDDAQAQVATLADAAYGLA